MRKNDYRKDGNEFLKTVPYILIAAVLALLVVILINA